MTDIHKGRTLPYELKQIADGLRQVQLLAEKNAITNDFIIQMAHSYSERLDACQKAAKALTGE